MTKYKSILFDFDGTIADTLEQARLVLNQLRDDYKFRFIEAEELPRLRELTVSELLKEIGISKFHVPMILAKGRKILKSRIDQIPLIPGMKEAIIKLRAEADTLAILTSNSSENVELFLAANGLSGIFDYIHTSSKLSGKSKHLTKLMKACGSDNTDSIYIGDEVRDIEACQKIGLPIISVTWGFNASSVLAKQSPDYQVDTVDELLDILVK